MARPIKNNASYFTHDSDMRNDVKIRALRRKYSHAGYAVWCFMIEVMTDSDGFEIPWNDLNQELLSADFDVSSEELVNIIDYCVKLGLLIIENEKLYSPTLKERFSVLMEKREYNKHYKRVNRKRENDEVLDDFQTVSTAKTCGKTDCQEVFDMENPTVKKSKVKKSKEEKSKEENIPEVTDVTSSSDLVVRHEANIDFDKLVDWFNSTTRGVFGDIRAPLGETRKTLIRARVREFGKDAFQKVVKNALQSAFLRGQNRQGFTASLDWLIKPSNFEKVLSGNFRNKDGYGHGTDDTRLSYKERDELAKQERLHASFQAVDAALAGYDDTLQGKTGTDGSGQMGSVALSP